MNYDSSSFTSMGTSPITNDDTGNNSIPTWPALPSLSITPSESTNSLSFRKNYDTLLKEVLEDDESQLNMIYGSDQDAPNDMDLDAATAELTELSDELRAVLEDRALADKYLADLKSYMHQRSHSMGSMASVKGDFSSPTTPLQPTFNIQSTSNSVGFNIQQDPLSKVLDSVPYQTRLINGVQSLLDLEKKLIAIKIPELDLPTVSDTVIKARLIDLYKIQDDLNIHLHGGPLVRNTHRLPIGDKKKKEIDRLLDQVTKEIGLYEEFVKRDNYLSLENILNESDSSEDEYLDSDTKSSIAHFETSSDISKITSGTPTSPRPYSTNEATSSGTSSVSLRRVISQSSLASLKSAKRFDTSSIAGDSIQSFDAISDPSMSQLLGTEDNKYSDEPSTPSEAFKWTPLKKISEHLYSKEIRQQSGLVSVLTVSGVIAVGTTRSLVYVYDYSQNLKCVLGDIHRAVELGAVTSLAISADYTTIACGYSKGHIVIWDIRKPQQPVRTIDPIPVNQLLAASSIPTNTNITITSTNNNNNNNNNNSNNNNNNNNNSNNNNNNSNSNTPSDTTPSTSPSIPSTTPQPGNRKEGHIHGSAILHIGFIGIKKTEIVSGDDQGMAFYHVLYKVMMVNAVDTTRILGRYQNLSFSPIGLGLSDLRKNNASSSSLSDALSSSFPSSIPTKPRRPSTVFAMQPLPLGQIPHPAENFALVALLTPYKMIIVGLKPSPQTKYKFLKPKTNHQPINTTASSSTTTNSTSAPQNESQQQQQQNQQQSNDIISENLSGCLAWLPVTKPNGTINKEVVKVKDKRFQKEFIILPSSSSGDPMLAFSWGNHLFILRVGVENIEPQRPTNRFRSPKPKRGTKLEFIKLGEKQLDDSIVGIQWINRQILVLFTPNEEMILFDPKRMDKIEHTSIQYKQLVYHDWFNVPLHELTKPTIESVPNSNDIDINSPSTSSTTTVKTIEMAYYHSLKGYKGKIFLLGLERLYVGHLLSWADRILILMKAGDFLEAIQLATSFYNGKLIQTVIGLPEDEQQRKQLVGEKLMELLKASLNYVFNPSRKPLSSQQQNGEENTTNTTTSTTTTIVQTNPILTTNGIDMLLIDRKRNTDAYDNNSDAILYQELAKCCVEASISMDNETFLFETAYEQFAENGVQGYFLEVLENYIVSRKLQTIPPDIMKDLVSHYSTHGRLESLERIIWHVNPECLEFQQILTICQREGLYEALMYLWNISSQDFVSPLVEMLKIIRQLLSKTEDKNQNKHHTNNNDDVVVDQDVRYRQAEKVFDYLKMVLRGLTYPDGTPIKSPIHRRESSTHASEARSAVYSFIFSGRCLVWPKMGGKLVLTVDENDVMTEPTYPYLRLLLRFNTKKFLETLEVAFEDPWLNGGDDIVTSTFEGDVLQGKVINRQIIVNTLFDVMGGRNSTTPALQVPNSNNNSFLSTPRLRPSISASTVQSGINNIKGSGTSSETTSYLDDQYQNDTSSTSSSPPPSSTSDDLLQLYIFIANNLPKYTTFIYLSQTTRQQILLRLVINDRMGYRNKNMDDDTRNERQRAVQELLSVHTPNNKEAMVSLYEEAKFWDVLEEVHRKDKRYGKLVETYLKNAIDTSNITDNNNNNGNQYSHEDLLMKQQRVFDCVEMLLDDISILTERQRQDVKNTILIRISQFVDIDGQRTADLIEKYFDANHHDILKRLSEDVEFDDDDEDDDVVDNINSNGNFNDMNSSDQSSSSTLSNGIANDSFSNIKSINSYVRMADKRIFSYLRGLLEPQYLTSSSHHHSSSTLIHSSTFNHMLTPIPNNELITDDDTPFVNNEFQQQQSKQQTSTTIQRSNIDANIQEKYIDLMCRFDPSGVYDYLNTKLYDYETHMNQLIAQQQQQEEENGIASEINHLINGSYRINLDTLLKSCETYGVIDAAVWIMEKKGQIQGALEKILELGKEKVQMILQIIKQQQSWTFDDQSKISIGLIGLNGVLKVGTRLCDNSANYKNINNNEQEKTEQKKESDNDEADDDDDYDDTTESLWFRLLDIYVESSKEIHYALDKNKNPNLSLPLGVQQYIISTFRSFVDSIFGSLLLSTSPQVSLPRLLLRLIDSQTKGETTFADFRDMFFSMLDTYKYEGQLLELTNHLFDRDLFLGVQDLVRNHKKGWRPQSTLCDICRTNVLDISLMQPDIWEEQQKQKQGDDEGDEENDNTGDNDNEKMKMKKIVVYHCGHVYHRHCLDLQLGKDDDQDLKQLYCILCDNYQQPITSSNNNNNNTPHPTVTQSKETVTIDKGKSKAT